MSEKRYFSVDEANALVPKLELLFTQVLQLRGQLRAAYQELDRLGEAPTAATLGRADGPPEARSARARFRALMEALAEELQAVEQTGATLKDLDLGLCDFLGQHEGREVWLCWQFGEKHIAYWHDLDRGFGARQPLDVEPAPRRLLH